MSLYISHDDQFEPLKRASKKRSLTVGVLIFLILCGFVGKKINDAVNRAHYLYHLSVARSQVQALMVYAGNNKNHLPEQEQWPEILVEYGIIEQELFDSVDKDGDGVSYVYLPGDHMYQQGSRHVLVYEDPKHWEDGVIVGFEDGSVEFVPHSDFEQMLIEQYTDLVRQVETP